MKSINKFKVLVVAFAAVVGFAAQAVEWSGEVTPEGDVSEPITLNGEVTVTVASGTTITLSGAISDGASAGSIKLVGGGTLALAAANTFTGGVQIDEGVMVVGHAGALGSGPVGIAGSTTGDCQLRIDTTLVGAAQTISNPIMLQGASANNHPAIFFVLPTSGTTAWTVTFTGGIKAEGNLYLGDTHGGCTGSTKSGKDWSGKKWVVFDCAIDAAGYRLQYGDRPTDNGYWEGPNGDVYFQGAVTAGTYCVSGYTGDRYGSAGSVYFKSAENVIDDFVCDYNHIYLDVADALGDARVNITDAYGSSRSHIYLKADQHARSLTSDKYKSSDTVVIRGLSASTLTLDGAAADSKTSYINLKDSLSLVVDARDDDFVQTLSSTTNTMTGTITVNRGTLRLVNNTKFASVSGITVSGGVLDAAGLGEDGFASVSTLTLGSAGRIDMGGRTLVVDTLTVDGAMLLYADHITHSDQIAEGTVLRARRVPAGMSYTTVDTTALGDWEIEVPAKSTNVVQVAQSGSGRIIKTGPGELLLTTANTFTGGIQLDEGTVTVAADGALGSGPVNVKGTTTGTCQLRIDFVVIGEPSTIENAITFENDSAKDHEALYFVYPTANTDKPAKKTEPWTVTFTGGITAKGTLCIRDNRGGNTKKDDPNQYVCAGYKWIIFDCPVNAAGQEIRFTYQQAPCGDVEFKQKVTAALFYASGYKNNNAYGNFWFDVANEIEEVDLSYCPSYLGVDNVFGDPIYSVSTLVNADYPFVYMQGHDLRVKSISSDDPKNSRVYGFYTASANRDTTSATLTIDGSAADGGKKSQLGFFGKLTLVLNAQDDDFVQTLRGSTPSTICGAIVVKKGTLIITESPTFKSLPEITVEGGVFESRSEVEGAFSGLTKLTVKNGGTFRVLSMAALPDSFALVLEKGAILDLPTDTTELTVTYLVYDGKCLTKGVYSKEQIAELPEGVTLNVAETGVFDAEWTGAGEDDLTTTPANWHVESEVLTTLDPTNGSLSVTLVGGDGMTYADGDWFDKAINGIVPNVENPVRPFFIRPATEGATLRLSHGLVSDGKDQLILSGHISGSAETTAGDLISYSALLNSNAGVEGAVLPVNAYGSTSEVLPLALTNAVLDLPLTVDCRAHTGFMACDNTTNEIRGLAKFTGSTFGISANAGSVTRFSGGFWANQAAMIYGPGEFQFAGEVNFGVSAKLQNGSVMTFDTDEAIVLGNEKGREGLEIQTAAVNLRHENALQDTVQVFCGSISSSILEIYATTQQLGIVNFEVAEDNNNAQIHGDYPALLKVTGKLRDDAYANQARRPYVNSRITGGLSIHFTGEGTNEVFTLAGRDFESCGDLIVSGKVLELAADATWLHGTNFTAKGEGMLKFAAAEQVNKTFATLHVADQGKIYVPVGVRMRFTSATLNGEPVEEAIYPTGTTGSTGLSAHIEGGGSIRIKRPGTVLIVQ